MRAERGKKGRGKRREKKRKKEEKMGIKIVFFFFFFFFFISPCACFFICAVVIFQTYKETVSRLSKSYLLLFEVKILMPSQFGDL